jgi:predicted transcriptional regulator
MVLDDRQMKVREIAEIIGISKERVGYILHEELNMKKLCARWGQRLLKADKKRTRIKSLISAWSVLIKFEIINSFFHC